MDEVLSDSHSKVNKILKMILFFNLLVLGIKLFIGLSSQSLSIIGDAVHSGVDSLNNIMGLCMVTLASQPPDREHPYGHEKFETLGALAVVAFLAVASFELIEKSIIRFFHPAELPQIDFLTISLLTVTLLINIAVWAYEKHAGEQYNSEFLKADAEHTFSDILITISILASTFFILKGYYILDPILGIVIAAVIIRSGWQILRRTIPVLLDQFWIAPEKIEEVVLSVNKACFCEDIKSRQAHPKSFIEMTVKFETDSLSEAHKLSHEIEARLIKSFGQAHVIIHLEPASYSNSTKKL